MSTDISYEKSDKSFDVRCIVHEMAAIESLSDYIRRIMHQSDLTFRDVEKRSAGGITAGYVSDIVRKKTKNPSVAKLKGLAKGLGRDESEVIAVARGEALEDGIGFRVSRFAEIANRFDQLSEEDKKELGIVLEMFSREVDRRALKGGGIMTGWRIPVTEPANQVHKDKGKRNRA